MKLNKLNNRGMYQFLAIKIQKDLKSSAVIIEFFEELDNYFKFNLQI